MAKVIILLAFFAVACAGYVHHPYTDYTAYSNYYGSQEHDEHYDPHPNYKFAYGVNDYHTGDSKSQFEERTGDVVTGEYSLVDPDGFKRIVKYTADPHNGFNAVVHREPLSHYAEPLVYKKYGHSSYPYYDY